MTKAHIDLEGSIDSVYGAAIVLEEFATEKFGPRSGKTEGSFQVFHLNASEIKALFYLVYAVHGHASDSYYNFYAKLKAEAALAKKAKATLPT